MNPEYEPLVMIRTRSKMKSEYDAWLMQDKSRDIEQEGTRAWLIMQDETRM